MLKDILVKLCVIFTLGFSFSSFATAPETIQWTYQYGLVTETQRQSIALSKMMIDYADQLDTQTGDVIAELLLTRYQDSETHKNLVIWYGRLLSGTKRKRYMNVLHEVAGNTPLEELQQEFKSLSKKLDKKHFKEEPAYKKGSVNIDLIKKGYIDSALAADLTSKEKVFKKLLKKNKKKVGIKTLFDALGAPQHLRLGGDNILFGLKFFYYYKGLGRADFSFDSHAGGFKFKGFEPGPLTYELEMPYYSLANKPVDNDLAFKMLLSSDDQTTVNILNYYVNEQFLPSQQFLDTAAEMLSLHLQDDNSGLSGKVFNWISRVLGLHGKGRYTALLEKTSKEGSERLRKHALRAIEETKAEANVEQFVPGVIDIHALAKQYKVIN